MTETSSIFGDQRLLRSVVEASPAGMVITDAEGTIVFVNPAAVAQFGYEAKELVGSRVDRLVPETHRPTHQSHRARYMEHPENRPMAVGRNLFARRKDGSVFPVDISLHPVVVGDRQMVLANVLDATDRQRAEQEREQRRAMERLAFLGQLAGGVAHEIRTPLCVIRNDVYYLKLLGDQLGEEGLKCLDEINQSVGKAERIVSELLDFTRDPVGEPCPISIDDTIDAALKTLSIPESITVQRLGIGGVQVLANPEQVERVFINLIRNAIEAMEEHGSLGIEVRADAQHATIDVLDDGPGMTQDHLERVFEPLFSTKPKGIGLGLAVSKRYAERNGGSLNVSNRVNSQGACFRLALPLVAESH